MKIRRGLLWLKPLGSLLLVLGVLAFFTGPLMAVETGKRHNPGRDIVNAIFISDKVTEVAYRLGVVPVAYCARCGWSMVQKEMSTVPRLGCYRCASVESVIRTAEEHKVGLVLIESGWPSLYKKKWNWAEKFGPPLKAKGYPVHLIDFSEGVPECIRKIGRLLHREKKAGELAAEYTRSLQKTMSKIPAAKEKKKILVLKGVGKRGVQVEAPGGYTDQYLLEPLGCVNVGRLTKDRDAKVSKGHFMLEDWRAVSRANPDIIVKLGSPYAVERGLAKAIKKYPELSEVPAVKSRAVYTLPAYYDGSATRYPRVLRDWLDAVYQK